MAKAKKLTLEQRVSALHEELDAFIAKHVDKHVVPGIPRGIIERLEIGRAGGCKCEALKLINGK